MNPLPLTRDEVIRRLQGAESRMRSMGVQRLALFGSVLRDEAGPHSDVDFLVEFAEGAKSFENLLALAEFLEDQLGRRVEVVTVEALSPFFGPRILAEAQDVVRAA